MISKCVLCDAASVSHGMYALAQLTSEDAPSKPERKLSTVLDDTACEVRVSLVDVLNGEGYDGSIFTGPTCKVCDPSSID